MTIDSQDTTVHIDYIDALRTLACFTVVMLHVTALNTYHVDFRSQEWNIFMFYEAIVNWAVPVFVMVSGAVLLRKTYRYQKIFKRVMNLAYLFAFWSLLYLAVDLLNNGIGSYRDAVWLQVLLQGHYHMWYLIMLVGLYFVIPIVKVIVDRPTLLKAFISLSIVFTYIIPSLKALSQLTCFEAVFECQLFNAVFRAFCNITEDFNFHLTLGFISYLVIGYVISRWTHLSKTKESLMGTLMLFSGTVLTCVEIKLAVSKEASGVFMQHYQASIALQACGVMMVAKSLSGTKLVAFLARIGPMTLGIYLIHPLLIEVLQKQGITSTMFNPMISIPILSFGIFALSGIIIQLIVLTPLRRLAMIDRLYD